ncbi:hypothetical protein BCR36DRAFT_584243 [Piromyces finnis]|uniref:Coth-domain-containing protein n=1 Tax=Piromyces finnis TaxID=1754191 RepID=A0A1Y1V8U3_9FUNG|nr:hypothetical protein BCR36DRAFT_584243 [Piromyces finnis]|eukprot:ORX48689.1 hypothetical protein BCR36DRAFT_584243 [Piromyces finnis]
MMFKQLLSFAFFAGAAFSRNATFKLISFGSKAQLQIVDGNIYDLSLLNDDILYGTTVSDAPEGSFKYYYIIDGKKESFKRTFKKGDTSTHNEFFGRKDTLKELKTFKRPENFKTWDRTIGKTELFDDSYIPTIHITGSKAKKFFKNPVKYEDSKLEKVTFYLRDSVETFTNVSSSAKNYEFSKFQIKMKLGKNSQGTKGFNGRYVLKLRNGGEDPINLRQVIYGNIIRELGMPALHSVMCRVYYEKKPAGFYTLQETVPTESFVNTEFYGNPKTGVASPPKKIGYIFDGTTGSDFEYKKNDEDYYSVFDMTSDDQSYDRLIAFTKAIKNLNPFNEKELASFEKKWFDIDTFHKAMAMEYLTGDWDGYWYTTANFAIYDDPNESTKNTYKFYFITQDHDETFGVGLDDDINTVGHKFPEISYTTMLNRTWHIAEDDAKYRTLVDKFIASTPSLHKRFQDTLFAIVKNIFNPVAFRDVVDSYYDRYEPEVKWDYSFTRPYVVKDQYPDYGYKDFVDGFEGEIEGVDWSLYEWVKLRSEAIKKEFCITWEGDANPPKETCVPKVQF